MIEFNLETSAGGAPAANFAVSVVGLGGSGANVLDRIALEGMPGAELICMSSDVRILNNSMAARKVQLGASLTQGLGAGGDPELGLEAAQASEAEIREIFKDRSMIFLCTGLGGGTGSGAAPYIAKLARESGAFVVVFATMPFFFEGRRRQKQANAALDELRRSANALVTFENDRMGELIVPKKGIQEAFQQADRIIGQSVRAVTSLVTQPGLIRIGMDDLITALRNTDSRCLFGFGQAKGENRALEALALALKSPLLDRGQMLAKAQNVLVHVCGGSTMTLFEIETLMRELHKHVHEDAHLLFGTASDTRLGDHISVTILTSLGREGSVEILPPRTLADTQPKPASPISPHISPLTPPAPAESPPPPATAMAAPVAPSPAKPVPVADSVPTVRLVAPQRAELRPVEAAPQPEQRKIPAPPAAAPAPAPVAEIPAHAPHVKAKSPSKAVALPEPELPAQLLQDEEEIEEEDEPLAYLPPTKNGRTPAPAAPVQAEEEEDEQYEEAEDEEEEEVYGEEEEEEEDLNPTISNGHGNGHANGKGQHDPYALVQDDDEEDEDEDDDPTPPPPIKKFAIRDILMKPRAEGNGQGSKPQPAQQQPPARTASIPPPRQSPITPQAQPAPRPSRPTPAAQQQTFDERLQGANRGRFEKTEPTVEEGEDLDVPTFLRKKR